MAWSFLSAFHLTASSAALSTKAIILKTPERLNRCMVGMKLNCHSSVRKVFVKYLPFGLVVVLIDGMLNFLSVILFQVSTTYIIHTTNSCDIKLSLLHVCSSVQLRLTQEE